MPDSAAAAVVRLRKTASVGKRMIRLADIAEVIDSDPQTVRKLEQIVLGPPPIAGKPRRLDFATIRSRLQAQGVDLLNTEFSGSSVVTISAAGKLTNRRGRRSSRYAQGLAQRKRERAERLVSKAVRRYFQQQAPELGSTAIEVRLNDSDVEKILEGAARGYEIRGGRPPWNGPQVLELRLIDQREQVRTVRVACRVSRNPQVVAVKHTVARGEVLKASDLVWRQAKNNSRAFRRMEDVVNKETNRTLHQGNPILAGDVRQVPLIRSNDFVTVYARQPGLSVKRQLKARSDGAMGDTVTLVTLDGREKVLARVIGYHVAETLDSGRVTQASFEDPSGKIVFRKAPPRETQIRTSRRLRPRALRKR